MTSSKKPSTICILALPESSGAVLYGLFEVLSVFSEAWEQITGENQYPAEFDVKIVAQSRTSFTCVGGVPVTPHASSADIEHADVVIVTDLAVDPDTDHRNKWTGISPWLHKIHDAGDYYARSAQARYCSPVLDSSITDQRQPIGLMSTISINFFRT